LCGIAGYFELGIAPEQGVDLLKKMLAQIDYRGPDEAGMTIFPTCGLGNVRLAIIDSEGGKQPFASEDKLTWLAFNGEIYNYIELRQELLSKGIQFKTESDTEVLLKGYCFWGKDVLDKLNGQFAFAIFEKQKNSLFLARDPYGERPLFYSRTQGGLYFASEIKSIFAQAKIPRRLNEKALIQCSETWSTLPDETCFEGIEQCPAGHWMEIDEKSFIVKSYHSIPTSKDKVEGSIGEVREKLMESVRIRLRSDVEVGTYLSGGLDSAIISSLAVERSDHKVKSFSVSFEDEQYDESKEQKIASSFLATDHLDVRIQKNEIAKVFPKVLYHSECIQFRTALAPLYILSSRVRDRGLKLVLTGEGADEFFIGYNIFKETLFRSSLESLESDEKKLDFIAKLYPYLKHFGRAQAVLQLKQYNRFSEDHDLFSHQLRFAMGKFSSGLFKISEKVDAQKRLKDYLFKAYPNFNSNSVLEKAQIIESLTLLQGYLLSSQGDRMSMAHGIESRCPFLDPRLLSYIQNIKDEDRLEGGLNEKALLKKSFAKSLPAEICKRNKQPYLAPQAASFLQSDEDWIKELLSEEAIAKEELFDTQKVSRLLKKLEKTPLDKISPKEDQAYLTILSTLMLKHLFIDQFNIKTWGSRELKVIVERN